MGVPQPEHGEFMAIIERYRSMVVGAPGHKDESDDAVVPQTRQDAQEVASTV